MKNENSIKQGLMELINSKYPKTQIDIHFEQQVVLHVFNQSDAKNWSINVPLDKEGGILINLFFNQNKKNNSQNFMRFEKCEFYQDFTLIEMNKGKVLAYYAPVSKLVSISDAAMKICRIIIEVYDLNKFDPLDIYVRIY
jgi:hypothetical protein